MSRDMFTQLNRKLGPGFLFAASAVGVSHLVQSSRAGAEYGFSLAWLLLLACLIKYPAFRFAADYAAVREDTLIDAYERQGRWVLGAMVVILPVDMFIASAAVSLVTAAILQSVFGLDLNVVAIASGLITLCGVILILGKYRVFESVTKVFVGLFVIGVLAATALAIPQLDWARADVFAPLTLDRPTLLFMIAAAGWMPTAMTASLFQSLWVTAKQRSLAHRLTAREVRLDFNLGYGFTAFLALCFVLLGTVFLFSAGIPASGAPAGFAAQLMAFFTGTIGNWAYPIIASAAIAVMFSTLLTLVDGCPRSYTTLIRRLKRESGDGDDATSATRYSWLVITQVAGVSLVLVTFFRNFSAFIDFATSTGFIAAPFIAYFNHRAIFSEAVPRVHRPGRAMYLGSCLCIAAMAVIACGYLVFSLVLS